VWSACETMGDAEAPSGEEVYDGRCDRIIKDTPGSDLTGR